MKYKIALGTKSEQKRTYLERELTDLGLEYQIHPFEVTSGVSDQPMTDEETRQGSVNRAKRAYEVSTDCDFGMGIEAGYHKSGTGYDIFCWVTIYDKNGKYFSHKSEHVTLPDFHANIINEGKYLGDHVQTYIEQAETEDEKLMGAIIKTREPFIREAMSRALKHYLEDK